MGSAPDNRPVIGPARVPNNGAYRHSEGAQDDGVHRDPGARVTLLTPLVRANRNSDQGSRKEPDLGPVPSPGRLLLAYLEPDYLGERKRYVSPRVACADPNRVAPALAKLTDEGSIVDVTEQREAYRRVGAEPIGHLSWRDIQSGRAAGDCRQDDGHGHGHDLIRQSALSVWAHAGFHDGVHAVINARSTANRTVVERIRERERVRA